MTKVSFTSGPPYWCPLERRLQLSLYELKCKISPNNMRMGNRRDLNLSDVVYISVINYIPVSLQNFVKLLIIDSIFNGMCIKDKTAFTTAFLQALNSCSFALNFTTQLT